MDFLKYVVNYLLQIYAVNEKILLQDKKGFNEFITQVVNQVQRE